MKRKIGITATEASYHNYPVWIKSMDADIEICTLSWQRPEELQQCQGLVLSGGVDTHPRFYQNHQTNYPNAPSAFDEKRDEFELGVFRFACEQKIPLLAVCRGMQLVNIALGGDMVQDIEASGKNNHRKTGENDGIHSITVVEGSLLSRISGIENGTVNSAHHQAIHRIADELEVTAWAPEGIAEALEWKNKEGKPFFLGVQWHPERLVFQQPENPLNAIRNAFLMAINQESA